MENNNETQKSTEQLYSNIEGSTIELETKVEEEPSFSLDDLHPEEKEEVKQVAPAASSAEEIQPDPTVIDGKRETIGDQSSINEVQPVQQAQPVQPTTPQQPVKMVVPQPAPVQQPSIQPAANVKKQVQEIEEPNAKVFYAVFAIILLVVLVGLPIYTSFQNMLETNNNTSEPVEQQEQQQNQTTDNTQTTPETPNEQPTPQQPEEIKFNMSLEFDKGFVTNEKEINQKSGYLPTPLNGVIRCDMEAPTQTLDITTYSSTYLHYENYKLRSAITVTKQVYTNPSTYSENKDATLIYKNAGDTNESLDVEIKQDDENLIVTNIMQFNLMYGHETYVEELQTNLMFSSQYNTNIKNAIANVIQSSNNIVCGTLNTGNTENATS